MLIPVLHCNTMPETLNWIETYFEVNTYSQGVDMLGQHLLIKGLVVEIQVFDDQLCGPHCDHLVFVALIGFVVLIFPQLFSASDQFKEQI